LKSPSIPHSVALSLIAFGLAYDFANDFAFGFAFEFAFGFAFEFAFGFALLMPCGCAEEWYAPCSCPPPFLHVVTFCGELPPGPFPCWGTLPFGPKFFLS
ncbi:hypothetical protein CLOP_g2785, partial [Closterium sp. NIES-67]